MAEQVHTLRAASPGADDMQHRTVADAPRKAGQFALGWFPSTLLETEAAA